MSNKDNIESRFAMLRELNIKKILIIRFSSLGDVILTTPLLKIVRENLPDSQIDYCTKKMYSEIFRFNPDLNNIIETSDELSFNELKNLKKKIVKENYDLIFDLHNNLRTFYLKLFLRFKSKVLVFKKYSFRKFLLVKFKINLMKKLPSIAQRYINVIMSFPPVLLSFPLKPESGNQDNPIDLQPEIHTNNLTIESVNKLITDLNTKDSFIPSPSGRTGGVKFICIIPSSKHFTKTYPAEYYIELINKFPKDEYLFLLIGKGNDKINIDKIKSGTGNNVYDLCDKLDLLELTELMKKCKLVISGDTGPMHIAEAVGVPIILLAGSSVKEFGFFKAPPFLPEGEGKNRILQIDLPCRPCSHIGKDHCPKSHFKCMKEIKPEMIYEEINKILKQ